MYSFWEREEWFTNIDFAVIGSGIVGLNCAIELRKNHPNAKIVIFEKGPLPSGASSKNAGFACFGSPTELISDLQRMSHEEVFNLVELRLQGLEKLKETCGKVNIDYQQNGSYEVFQNKDKEKFQKTVDYLSELNKLLFPIFNKNCFTEANDNISNLGFKDVSGLIFNHFEGQIDTGKMIRKLISVAQHQNIEIINGCSISNYIIDDKSVLLNTGSNLHIKCSKLFIATNGFAKKFFPNMDCKPARAQVLITHPIKNLHLNGTFHLDEGYYYFRNINNRILLGGGRNLDFKGEETTANELSAMIQTNLDNLLKEVILPNNNYSIDMRWTGIMGVGNTKKPILQKIENNVFCGIRLGGMGVAIGSIIGEKLARLLND
jgi:glycine/D-amino acid oxidase-like deaminating enzyme